MPLKRCEDDGKPGWKWGDAPSAKCYTYTAGNDESEMAARKKAMAQAAAMGEFPGTGNRDDPPLAAVEFRAASVAGVNFDQRIIEVIAVPYEQPAMIEYRGSVWSELFQRGAFDGIETRQDQLQVRVNRNHDKTQTVGKVTRWWPERSEGLVSEVRIAKTDRGNETLELADEDMLSPSIGFVARGRDQLLDKATMTRRITKAFIDHLSFVESPAYAGAKVLAVRDRAGIDDRPPLDTPHLDELVAFLNSRKA